MDNGKTRGTESGELIQKQMKLKTKRQKSAKEVVGGSCEGSIDTGENVGSENKEVSDSGREEVSKMVDLEKRDSIEKKSVVEKCAHEESVQHDTMGHFENQQVNHSKNETVNDSENRNNNDSESGDDSDSKYEVVSHSNNEESNDSKNEEPNDSESEESNYSENEDFLYFDFGTTNFSTESDITQIGAVRGKEVFTVYVRSNRPNSFRTSKLNGRTCGVKRNLRRKAECVGIHEALRKFINFISAEGHGSILVGHYIKNFDCKVLYHAVSNSKRLQEGFSSVIKGFIDIHKVFRKVGPKLESYSLDNIFRTYCANKRRPKRRDALSNSRMARKLFHRLNSTPETRKSVFSWKSVICFCSLKPLMKRKALTQYMGRKLAAIGLGYDDLLQAYNQSPTDGIDLLFSKRVGKHEKTIKNVSNFFCKHQQI